MGVPTIAFCADEPGRKEAAAEILLSYGKSKRRFLINFKVRLESFKEELIGWKHQEKQVSQTVRR